MDHPKRDRFDSHWTHPEINDIPINIKSYDGTHYVEANQWLQHIEYHEVYMISGDRSHFYCNRCKKWGSMGDSAGNLNKHIKRIHFPNERTVNQNVSQDELDTLRTDKIPPPIYLREQKEDIAKRLKADYILQGRSFQSIEKSHFQEIIKISAEFLKSECTRIANVIKSHVYNVLKSVKFGFLSFDEWSDKSHRRYLGIIGIFLLDNKTFTSLLGLKDIDTIIADSTVIASLIKNTIDQYQLNCKIYRVVCDNFNLMNDASRVLGIPKMPCICHI